MKQRLHTILQVLNSAEDYTTIEDIARLTDSSVRTIHRDLDSLERSLSYRHIRLERRRGYGVRLLDELPNAYADQVMRNAEITGPSQSSHRPLLMLMYLLMEADWVKISQLAGDFFISDSSVSSDLSNLEQGLPQEICLVRQKGVGVRLEADELVLRKLFVTGLPLIFPPHTINSLIASGTASRNWLLNSLQVSTGMQGVETAVAKAVRSLGMSFSPRHELLLIAYLLLLSRRMHDPGPLLADDAASCFARKAPELFMDCAGEMGRIIIESRMPDSTVQVRQLPEGEYRVLAQLLCSLEPAAGITADSRELLGPLYPAVKRAIELTLGELEQRHRLWLHDDHQLTDYLRVTVAAALHRMEFDGNCCIDELFPPDQHADSPVARMLAGHVWESLELPESRVSMQSFIHHAEEAILALEARLERRRGRRQPVMNVKILCYEGMGMTSYLRLLAEKLLPPNTRFDVQWETDMRSLARAQQKYQMLISTFPIPDISIPHVRITPDMNADDIRAAIQGVLELTRSNTPYPRPVDEAGHPDPVSEGPSGISLSAVMAVLQDFCVTALEKGRSRIDQAVEILGAHVTDREQLRTDFIRREEYGSLVFEEYGIQLLHCRSTAIAAPRAAVLQAIDGGRTLLVMAAPSASSPAESRVLSEIVIALSDDSEFPALLSRGSLEEIQKRLFRHFSRLMD